MRTLIRTIVICILTAFPAFGQTPQIPLTGNIGAGGVFPLVNSPTVSFASDANHTMAYPEMSGSSGFLKVTSGVSLTAQRNLVAPLTKGFQFTIENATTGGQSIQVIGSSGTGVVITNGSTVTVACDGTNWVQSGSSSSSAFNAITSGTNTTATMTVGSGATLTPSGTGVIQATDIANTIQTGTNISFSGAGTVASPYVISSATGVTTHIIYVSQIAGIHQNTDLTAGGGGDDTALINTALAAATSTDHISLVQDGASLISGNGIAGPPGGNWDIAGNGGGITTTNITSCGVTSNVATFVTTVNQLAVGQHIQVAGLTNCTALNNAVLMVNSSGLTSTGFTANFTTGNVTAGAENAKGITVFGTGFYLASGSGDAISNGIVPVSSNCEAAGQSPASRGTNIGLSSLVINGNAVGQTTYCHGLQIANINNLIVDNVVFYNISHYSLQANNIGIANITRMTAYASAAGTSSINTDGVHIEGPSENIHVSDLHCHTGDDCIALNAIEGDCGPITNVSIDSVTLDSSYRALRAYNNNVSACSNGLVPLISNVTMSNVNGTVYSNYVILGLSGGTAPGLSPAIDNMVLSNWNVRNTNTQTNQEGQITIGDAVGHLTLSNFTFDSPAEPSRNLIETLYGISGDNPSQLSLVNVKVLLTPLGNSMSSIFDDFSSPSSGVGNLLVDGFTVSSVGGSYGPLACLICTDGGGHPFHSNNVVESNIDKTNITSVYQSTDLSGDIVAYTGNGVVPGTGGVFCINSPGPANCDPNANRDGFAFYPATTGSGSPSFFGGTGPGNPPVILSNYYTGGATGGAFIDLNANSFGDGSQNQLFMGNAGNVYAVLDGQQSGHTPGNFGIGYGYGAIVPKTLSVVGTTGFGCSGVTCHATVDASGNLTVENGVITGTGTPWSVTPFNGSLDFNNGSADGPGFRGYYANNTNIGFNVSNLGVPATCTTAEILRFVKDFGETGGAVIGGADRNANLCGWSGLLMPSGGLVGWNGDTGISRDSAGVIDVGNGTAGNKSGVLNAAYFNAGTTGSNETVIDDVGVYAYNSSGTLTASIVGSTGVITGQEISLGTACNSNTSPAVCGASAAGSVAVASGGTTLVVDTTAVDAFSQILLTFDSSLGSRLSVTCNATINQPTVSARTPGTSFTITMSGSISTNPDCISYTVIN